MTLIVPTVAMSSDQEGLLEQIANTLNAILAASGVADSATRRMRVLLEAATATNISVNQAQFNSVAPLTGLGPEGSGGARVTPSNGTAAGLPAMHPQSTLSVIYNAIATS